MAISVSVEEVLFSGGVVEGVINKLLLVSLAFIRSGGFQTRWRG